MPDVYASLTIDAPVAEVWDKIKNFHDFTWAPGIITSCAPKGDVAGNEPGAKRLINEAFLDRLLAYDPGSHSFKYTIEEAPSPLSPDQISDYVGHLRLSAAGDGQTLAEYSASWESEDTEAVKLIDGIYNGLLKELSQQLGK